MPLFAAYLLTYSCIEMQVLMIWQLKVYRYSCFFMIYIQSCSIIVAAGICGLVVKVLDSGL